MPDFIPCHIQDLHPSLHIAAAKGACRINPINRPALTDVLAITTGNLVRETLHPEMLAVLTTKYWGASGVRLGVSFLDAPEKDLIDRILSHMNAWGQYANVAFAWSQSQGQVRISRGTGGYWSYLGTDILHVEPGQQTMNLQGFTMATPESEFHRVVRHETGHTLGFPHEHLLPEIVARLDTQKTLDYFMRTQGWSSQMTVQQVLTPLSLASVRSTPHADVQSIMCYQLPGEITKDGQPIPGGLDIDESDGVFANSVYPRVVLPNPSSVKTRILTIAGSDFQLNLDGSHL